jgi:hypothetical protein
MELAAAAGTDSSGGTCHRADKRRQWCDTAGVRFFNTAGPVDPEIHYLIPPLSRLDLAGVLLLIEQRKYFVLHAPRQTGKTSALLALMEKLNGSGRYRCVYVNVETGQSAREDVGAAMRAILGQLASEAEYVLNDRSVASMWAECLGTFGPHDALRETLSRFAAADAKPLVLLIDESTHLSATR